MKRVMLVLVVMFLFAASAYAENYALEFDRIDDYVEITGFKGISGTAARTCTASDCNMASTIPNWPLTTASPILIAFPSDKRFAFHLAARKG